MAKYLLVIDIDDDYFEDYENFYVNYELRADRKDEMVVECLKFVEECKIKPMPEKAKFFGNDGRQFDPLVTYLYNSCIDEILGENDEQSNSSFENA